MFFSIGIVVWGLLYAAYLLACVLLAATAVMAGLSTYRAELRNAFLLWISSLLLFFVLWAVPRLQHYVNYGVRSKTVIYTSSGHWLAVLAIACAAMVRGKAKWLPIAAGVLGFAVISLISAG
ncbi:MAG TPA: hypothetical protein VM865_08730 [Acidobacteriaceae bacterium]|jgi:hypothetical protein|nr:hypothetical protein [Acidobacteriaceae bacterium]